MYREVVRAFPVSLCRSDTILTLAAALFVLTWPLEKRHLILTAHSFVTGAYTEAGTIALYLSDIAFLFLGAAWFWRAFRALRNPNTETPWSLPISHQAFWIGVGFVCWAAFRALPLTPSALGWYAALRIAQGFLLFLMTADLWKVARVRTAVVSALLFVGVFQALLGSSQVLLGRDLGLRFLGEQRLSLQKPGVAKVDLDISVPSETLNKSTIGTAEHRREENSVPSGTKLLRAYGTFPHPNVLGGFLALVIFYEIHLVFNQIRQKQERGMWLHSIVFFLTLPGAILTFSRSSWLSIAFGFAGLVSFYRNIDRLRIIVLLSLTPVALLLVFSAFSPVGTGIYRRFLPLRSDMFLQERIEFLRETVIVMRKNPLVGVGTGNGLISLVEASMSIDNSVNSVTISTTKAPWQHQYPHNVAVVIALELGMVGIVLAGAFVFLVLKRSVRTVIVQDRALRLTRVVFIGAAVLSPLLLDHYLWTAQQGRILLWGLLGVLASSRWSTHGAAEQALAQGPPATR